MHYKISELARSALLGVTLALAIIAPLQAAGSYEGSGAQPASRGGTGRASLNQNALIFGNGTAPVGFIAPGTNGRCLVDNGTIWTPGYCVTSSGAAATGTTGHAVPFLDGANMFSALQVISLNASSLPAAQVGTLIRAAQADGVSARMQIDSFGAASFYSCARTDGTNASPAPLAAADEICSFNSFGNAGAGDVGPSAALRSYAAEAWSSGHQGTYWRFATTADGSTTLTDRIGIENDGGITLPPSVTGGSKGTGTFNAGVGYYVGGVALENIFALSGSFSLPSGTLTLQPAGASTLGGVNSIAQVAHQSVQYIDTAGLPHLVQTAFSDLSGQWSLTQGPTIGANTVLCSVAGGTPITCTQAQLTAMINLASATLPGLAPAWPGNTTTFARGDGTYATLNFAALSGSATLAQLPSGTSDSVLGYWGSTVVSGAAIPNCSNSLTYSTATHLWGCNTAAGTGTMTALNQGVNTTANPGAGVVLSTNPCTTTCAAGIDPAYLRGYISGCTLSNDPVTPNTVIDIAICVATSDTQSALMKLSSAITKNMNSTWVVGSTNGCADGAASYTSLGVSTWYHLFEIERLDTGVSDVLCSLSATAPTLPTNYTAKRRLGSIKTDGSSHIIAFTQSGTEFLWSVPALDINVFNPSSTSGTLGTLSVPTGVQVTSIVSWAIQNTAAVRIALLVTSPDQADTAAAPASASSFVTGLGNVAGAMYGQLRTRTNTSSQVRYRVDSTSATVQVFGDTFGWVDNL